MTRIAFPLACLLLVSPWASAQSGSDLLDVDLMFVGAHPDDDTGILATFARYLLDEGFRGTVVTATGGDGGGNAIGPEAGRALALIRKEEERRALALVGVDSPSFLGLPDFYFTLSAEETERKWGEGFVCDVVRHVRLERPEVIVTMWPGPGTHGQHQMAARAGTIAFARAGEPGFCPEQLTEEFLKPFVPKKLYYYDRESPTSIAIPTDDFSPAKNMSYADVKALGYAMYRSQGFDRLVQIPVESPRPERFMLVRSRVPVSEPERHLLEGALLPSGRSPAGIELRLRPERFSTGIGTSLEVKVLLRNETGEALRETTVSLEPPEGFRLEKDEPSALGAIAPGESAETVLRLSPTSEVSVDRNLKLVATYDALREGRSIGGSNFTWIQASAPVRVGFVPLYDVAGYREFARETGTEWVIESLPTRVPLVLGRTSTVRIAVENASEAPRRGSLELELPEGASVRGSTEFEVQAGGRTEVPVEIELDERVLPEGRRSVKVPVKVRAPVDGLTSEETADLYVLPLLEIPLVASAPTVDGDLSDLEGFASAEIGPKDLWWRREPEGPSDASAVFHLAYDRDFLYAGVRVRDDAVVCNIAPDDVRAQLRSDALGITVDPSGASRDTSTVLQAAAFPCTTEGFGARGFRDADARQGLMEETAPGMEVASRKTEDGYTFEAKIPWAAMPERPSPGDEIAVNVVLYDGDDRGARVGANVSESGLAWAAFAWGGKQALPYLWPRVVLKAPSKADAIH